MSTTGPRASPDTPIAALLPMMADGEVDAVPVLDVDRITGIVTRTDLIAAMARSALGNLTVPAPANRSVSHCRSVRSDHKQQRLLPIRVETCAPIGRSASMERRRHKVDPPPCDRHLMTTTHPTAPVQWPPEKTSWLTGSITTSRRSNAACRMPTVSIICKSRLCPKPISGSLYFS